MIKKLCKLIIIVVFMTTLTACWDFEDLNKKNFLLSVGVDKVGNNVEFSGEATGFVPAGGRKEKQSQQPQSQENFFQYSGIGKDIEMARLNVEQGIAHSIFLGEIRVIIFGKSYAENGIADYLRRIDNIYDFRKSLIIVVSKEPAKSILSFPGNRNMGIGFYIEDNIKTLTKNSNAIYTKFTDMLPYKYIEGTGFFLPYIGIENNSIRYLGLGVMKNFKLIDFIDIKDTKGILYLLNKKPVIIEEVFLNNNNNIFKVQVKKRDVKTDYKDNNVIINIAINLNASLLYQLPLEPVDDRKQKELENKISEKVKKSILESIYRSQKDYSCDTFGFSKYFRIQNFIINQTINWQEEYPYAIVNVNVNTKILNTNLKDTEAESKITEGEGQ